MKKKTYLNFALPRIICALVIGAIVFGLTDGYLKDTYGKVREAGFNVIGNRYRDMLRQYDEGRVDADFMRVILAFYASDYYRFAKVNDEGDFETIAESEYDIIPIEMDIHNWYLATQDEELAAKGTVTSKATQANGIQSDWNFTYVKCDELFDLHFNPDKSVQNAWNLLEFSDLYWSTDPLFQICVSWGGVMRYRQIAFDSYYVEGDTLYPGKIFEANGWLSTPKIYKTWDFTDPAKADRYHQINHEIESLAVFDNYHYPQRFINANKEIFLVNNMSDIEKIRENEGKWSSGLWTVNRSDYEDGVLTKGEVSVFEVNGNTYMVEYIISSTNYSDYFRPFLICIGLLIFVLCVAVALILAIHPYSQYKKAYENNNFKNTLIDLLAHNLKTPLQILGGYAENLKDVNSDSDKNRYSDQILAKTSEMNNDIEAILKTAEKSDRKFVKDSVRALIEEAAKKAGSEPVISGDNEIKMDKDYFSQALFCLIDNAEKYKTEGTKTDIKIDKNGIVISNKTGADKFTPGTGIAIAERILEQHKLYLKTAIKGGIFEAKITKKPAKK